MAALIVPCFWVFLFGLQHPESAAATGAACAAVIYLPLWWSVATFAD